MELLKESLTNSLKKIYLRIPVENSMGNYCIHSWRTENSLEKFYKKKLVYAVVFEGNLRKFTSGIHE